MSTLSEEVYQERINKIREKMKASEINGYVIFSNRSIAYLTGYRFIPTERPI